MRLLESPRARAFAACGAAAFLAAGIPWWLAPYNRFTFSHPAALLGSIAFTGIAAGFAGWGPLGLGRTVLAAGGAVPAAVMARVLVDTLRDPTSHNLWPFEVVLAGMFGAFAALAAGLVGRLCRRLLGPD
jgi:hypothetical protein